MMRPAAAERIQAEQVLDSEGWTVVKIDKGGRDMDPTAHISMLAWCEKTIGPGRVEPGDNWLDGEDVWYGFTWYGYWNFYFKNERDATMFTLRWA